MNKTFDLNGKSYTVTQGESGQTYFDGVEQSIFFRSLPLEEKRMLDRAEMIFNTAGNKKSRREILADLYQRALKPASSVE